MNIRYSFKIEDFEEISEVADKLSPRRRRIRFALVFTGVLLLVAPFLTGSGPSHPDQFLLGMGPLAICLIVWGLQNPRRVARKYYAPEIDGIEHEATITQDGITTTSPTCRMQFQWTAFGRMIEGKNGVALIDKTIMYVFPRRAFNPEEWTDFLSLLQEHIPVWDGSTRSIRLL
jgi:hypothetical protein